MILEVLLWLPTKVILYFFAPTPATCDSLANMSNQAIDDYFKENPL